MEQRIERHKQRQKRRIRLFLFFVLCFLAWTGYTAYTQSSVLAQKREELEALRKEAEAARQVQAELMYKYSRLQDKEYIAELARKHYFLSLEGETLFVLPE